VQGAGRFPTIKYIGVVSVNRGNPDAAGVDIDGDLCICGTAVLM
jgi:hypothetical protein